MLDHRGVAKVPFFSGRRQDFEEWIFPFESYAGLLGWDALMIKAHDSPMNIDICL